MYPLINTDDQHHPPAQKGYTPAPPPYMGIPVAGDNQYHPPSALHVQPRAPGQWSTGLCDCFDDVGNCCITFFCPCVTFGRVAEIVDSGSTSCGTSGALYALILHVTGCACLYSCFYRSKMRKQYALPGDSGMDCLLHFFCEKCALCQEYREFKNRGFDMELGWHGSQGRQGLGATTPPATQSGMTR